MSGSEMRNKASPAATGGDTRQISTPDSPSGSISSPGNGDLVSITEDIEGKVVNLGSSGLVWVVVYSHSANRYYPHTNPANVDSDGRWISPSTVIGASDDVKNDFGIFAIIADDSTQQVFRQYFQTPERQGMEELPATINVIDRITVKRR